MYCAKEQSRNKKIVIIINYYIVPAFLFIFSKNAQLKNKKINKRFA
jgi:hypothetical protein